VPQPPTPPRSRGMRPISLLFTTTVAVAAAASPTADPRHAPRVGLLDGETIPRQIYTFWHEPGAWPEFIAACIAALKHHNPSWTLRVIHPGDPDIEAPPVESLEEMSPQQLSDWYRLAALGKSGGGGVWIDASTIVMQRMESWVNMSSPALQGFRTPYDNGTIESWAFAVPQDNAIMKQWLSNFRRALLIGVSKYCTALTDEVVGQLRTFLPYLTICAAYREARHQLPREAAVLLPSQEPGGPTHYISSHNGDPNASISYLFGASEEALRSTPFVKLRGTERSCVRPLRSYAGSWLAKRLLHGLRMMESISLLVDKADDHYDASGCHYPGLGYNTESLRVKRARQAAKLLSSDGAERVATRSSRALLPESER